MAKDAERRATRVVGSRVLPPRFTAAELNAIDEGEPDGNGPWTGVDGLSETDLDNFLSGFETQPADLEAVPEAEALKPALREQYEGELAKMEPSTRLAHDTIVDALQSHHRRRLAAGHHLCLIVHVPHASWTAALQMSMLYVLRSVSLAEDRAISLTSSDLMRVEHDRYNRARPHYIGLERLVDRLTYGHVVVGTAKGEEAADMGVVRALADVEIAFDPGSDRPALQSVIALAHPGFTWPRHVDARDLRPKALDIVVKRALSAAHVMHLLEKMLPAVLAEEAAEDEKVAAAEAVSQRAGAYNSKPKTSIGGVEILHPQSPRVEDLRGYGEGLSGWASDLVEDLAAFRAGTLPWSDVDGAVLLAGPPGTGKTLFASALAASAGVPMIASSYADWQGHGDGHLGTLIKRMRAVFKAATDSAPCILLIDEVDAIAARGSGTGAVGRHDDWWSSVVAALLECMDGTNRREGIVVIGACNHPDKLDPALVRSGRLDRRFDLGLPDEEALRGIFAHHLPGVAEDAFEAAAVSLAGAISGADVARFAREARRAARRQGRQLVVDDLLAVAMPADTRTEEHQRLIAIHEAGHAVAGIATGEIPVSLSVVMSGGNHGGVVMKSSMGLERVEDFETHIVRMLSGRAAEEVVFGTVCAGSGGAERSDLAGATRLIYEMHGALGFGSRLSIHKPSPSVVEADVQRLYARAVKLMTEHRADVEALADLAQERRVLSQRALAAFAEDRGFAGISR